LCLSNQGPFGPSGFVMLDVQLNGNLKATFVQDFNVNDNTYGTNSIGWDRSHKFMDLTGSDHVDWEFRNGAGQVVLSFAQDYISAAPTSQYPSGYGTLGLGGDGKLKQGDAMRLLAFSSSLTENLNKEPFLSRLSQYTVNSPALSDPNSAFWEYRMIYTVVVDQAAFGPSGLGTVTITDQHNSPQKKGPPMPPQSCPSCVTNIAVATGRSGNVTLSGSASAVVCLTNIPRPCLAVSKEVACLLPGNNCSPFAKLARGLRSDTQIPAFCYSVTVRNCGLTVLTNLLVVDDQLPGISTNFPSI